MKNRISFKAIFINLLLAVVFGSVMALAVGVNPIIGTAVVFGLGTGLQFVFKDMLPKGAALAGVYREIWTGELVESLAKETEQSFLREIPDYSRYVQASAGGENEVIHLVDIGADPEVLINNSSYPIGYESLNESDLPFSLDKYQTKATKVTDDELYAITYDKIGVVNQKHVRSILKEKQTKAAYSLAPEENTATTPVLKSTGDTVGGLKQVTVNDLIDFAGKLSDADVPDDGQRILVLNSKHVTGLLKEVKNFYKDYANIGTGQVNALLYGFKTYVYNNMPFYKKADDKKASFGAVFSGTDHVPASFAFYAPDMFRAQGSTKMYFDEPDTQNQMSAVNYRHYYLVSPRKTRAIGALVNDVA